MKRAGKIGVVSRFPVFHIEEFDCGRGAVMHFVPIHPPKRFIFLHALPRNINGADVRFAAALVIIRLNLDTLAGWGANLQKRGHLSIIRQLCLEQLAAILVRRCLDVHIRYQPAVFPLGHRPLFQMIPRRHRQGAKNRRRRPRGVIELRLHPARDVAPGIKANVGLGQPIIGMRSGGIFKSRMRQHLPSGVADNLPARPFRLKNKPRLAAVIVGESIFAPIPHQHRYGVVAAFQFRADFHFVVIGVPRCGPPLQAAFEDDELAIDPKPILGIHRQPRPECGGPRGQCQSFAEAEPGVAVRLRRSDPLRGPRRIGSAGPFGRYGPQGQCDGQKP